MRRLTTIAQVRSAVRAARTAGQRVALAPTLGALHDGHLSNVRLAAERADRVVVSVFVNPTQFGPGEDYDAYPRDLEGDEARLAGLGDAAPDLVFAPAVEEMFPDEPLTTVSVSRLGGVLCGLSRPGHFDAVATVVTKLLTIVAPDVAVFGRKDFQQLQVIRRVVHDLDLPVEVVAGPTVREPDGVAMSSRNAYLSPAERRSARALSQGLRAAVEAARRARDDDRRPDPARLRDAAGAVVRADPRVTVEYVEAVDPQTLTEPDAAASDRELLVAVAARVGAARLIDNVVIGDIADEDRLVAATDPEQR